MSTTKSDLLNQISKNYPSFLKKDLDKLINIILKEIIESLNNYERVELRNIASFGTKKQKKRVSRNPKTNEKINVPEKKTIYFKASKEWLKKINE